MKKNKIENLNRATKRLTCVKFEINRVMFDNKTRK